MIARTIRKVATGGSGPIAKNGHPFDEANTKWIVDKKGRRIRICRACVRYRGRGFREKLYGLSLDGSKRLLEEQGGFVRSVAARRAGDRLASTTITRPAVRGLLCSTCNSGHRGFCDDAGLMIDGIVYLNQHRGPS